MKIISILITLFIFQGCASSGSSTSPEANNINAQIQHIDHQIAHVEAMINSARTRQMSGLEDKAAIESELANYEAQKNQLIIQKEALKAQKTP